DLVEPLCIRAARVNLYCETERRDEDCLSFFEIVFVNVTLEVSRNRELGPTPVAQRRRVKLQPSARCWKTALNCSLDVDAGESTSIFVTIRNRKGNDVWSSRFRRAREDSSETILLEIVQLSGRNCLFVNSTNLLF